MFDQRALKQTSDSCYFQLVPITLNITNQTIQRALKTSNSTFRLVLLKGTNSHDEMRNAIPGKPIAGKIPFEKVYFNFHLPSNSLKNKIEFKVSLLQQDDKDEVQIGQFDLNIEGYVAEFRGESKTKQFMRRQKFNMNYSLDFEVFVDETRYMLEKFIRSVREQKKNEDRVNMVRDGRKKNQTDNVQISRTKSEVYSDNVKGLVLNSGEERFISPRRIVRKNTGQRRVLMRNLSPPSARSLKDNNQVGIVPSNRDNKPVMKQPTIPIQNSMKADRIKQQQQKKRRILQQNARTAKQAQAKREQEAKKRKQQQEKRKKHQQTTKKQQQTKPPVQTIQKKQEDKTNKQIKKLPSKNQQQDHPTLKVHSQSDIDQNLGMSRKRTIENKIGNQGDRPSQSHKGSQPSPRILMSTEKISVPSVNWNAPVEIKMTSSATMTRSGRILPKKQESMDLKTQAMYVAFMVVSLVLIFMAMSPSRKV